MPVIRFSIESKQKGRPGITPNGLLCDCRLRQAGSVAKVEWWRGMVNSRLIDVIFTRDPASARSICAERALAARTAHFISTR